MFDDDADDASGNEDDADNAMMTVMQMKMAMKATKTPMTKTPTTTHFCDGMVI